jgi:hypothetical protein
MPKTYKKRLKNNAGDCSDMYVIRTATEHYVDTTDRLNVYIDTHPVSENIYSTRTFVLRSKRNHIRLVYSGNSVEKLHILRQMWDMAHLKCTVSERVKLVEIYIPCRHDDLCAAIHFEPTSPHVGSIYMSSNKARLRLLALSMALSYNELTRFIQDMEPIYTR